MDIRELVDIGELVDIAQRVVNDERVGNDEAGASMMIDDPTVATVLDLQITHGNPTAEELAIVAAIVTATGQAGISQAGQQIAGSSLAGRPPAPSEWATPARRLRRPLPTGGWANSLRR